jgi:hypothetical protein
VEAEHQSVQHDHCTEAVSESVRPVFLIPCSLVKVTEPLFTTHNAEKACAAQGIQYWPVQRIDGKLCATEPHYLASFGSMPAGAVVVYAPRDEQELEVCYFLFSESYHFACIAKGLNSKETMS